MERVIDYYFVKIGWSEYQLSCRLMPVECLRKECVFCNSQHHINIETQLLCVIRECHDPFLVYRFRVFVSREQIIPNFLTCRISGYS